MQVDKNAIFQMRFPQKLWYLLNLRTDAILWGGTGRTILLNYRILHNYLQCDHSIFKTTNISSFVRQLNLYGFRKVTSHLQDPLCNSSNPYMHEYVHDYFQFGRPELLNKITRKALAMRKNFKPKTIYGNTDQFLYTTPLQKARRALHIALRKAAQDMLLKNSPKQICNLTFEDSPDPYYEDDSVDCNWIFTDNHNNIVNEDNPSNKDTSVEQQTNSQSIPEDNANYGETSQDSLMNFSVESCQQNNDNFSTQFLSMPELDPEPTEESSRIELLAEFDIDHDIDQDVTRKISDKQKEYNSLNCVLPSISNDQIDDVTMAEKNNDDINQYNDGEWDQVFNDIIINKVSNQECGSELKELYSQISRTIDLLNS